MKQTSKRRLDTLPEHVRHDPAFQAWLLLEHDEQISHLEHQSHHRPATVQTPIGRLPTPLVVFVVLWLLYMNPDRVYRALGL
jgi:hypothetical protein